MEKFQPLAEENQGLRVSLSNIKNQLALTVSELVNQAGQVINQKTTIKELNEKIKVLELSLSHAFDDIKKLHLRLEEKEEEEVPKPQIMQEYIDSQRSAEAEEYDESQEEVLETDSARKEREIRGIMEVKRARELMEAMMSNGAKDKTDDKLKKESRESYQIQETNFNKLVQNLNREEKNVSNINDMKNLKQVNKIRNIEIDSKLKEIMKKTKIPMKFVRIGEGLYVFGSKRVHIKALNEALVVRTNVGYIPIDEFIKLYAYQELTKLKTMKGEITYTNIEDEDLPLEADLSQIIIESETSEQNTSRDFSKSQISNQNVGQHYALTKRKSNERNLTPEHSRKSSITSKSIEFNRASRRESDGSNYYERQDTSPNTSSVRYKQQLPKTPEKVESYKAYSAKKKIMEEESNKAAAQRYSEQKVNKANVVGTRKGNLKK